MNLKGCGRKQLWHTFRSSVMFIVFWNIHCLTVRSYFRSWCQLVLILDYFTTCHCTIFFVLCIASSERTSHLTICMVPLCFSTCYALLLSSWSDSTPFLPQTPQHFYTGRVIMKTFWGSCGFWVALSVWQFLELSRGEKPQCFLKEWCMSTLPLPSLMWLYCSDIYIERLRENQEKPISG